MPKRHIKYVKPQEGWKKNRTEGLVGAAKRLYLRGALSLQIAKSTKTWKSSWIKYKKGIQISEIWKGFQKLSNWRLKANVKVSIWNLLTRTSARTQLQVWTSLRVNGKVQGNFLEINSLITDLFLCYCQSKVNKLDNWS